MYMNSQLRTKKPLEAAQYIGMKNPRYLCDQNMWRHIIKPKYFSHVQEQTLFIKVTFG